MPKSNPKPNKYANKSPQLRDAGFLVTLGGADEIAHHYRKHFQHLLEQLTIDESGVCEGRPIGQSEMRQMAQCLRELGFVQDRNATRGPGLSRTRKWRWPGTGDTGAAR